MSGPLVTGNKRASNAERGMDLYETPPIAVRCLVDAERSRLPAKIWEPACGPGAIAAELRLLGYTVRATDLVNYSSPHQDESGLDFLLLDGGGTSPAIVTNPPFLHARRFVELATERAAYVAMLLRLAFLESQDRLPLFRRGDLARVHVFGPRLPMMHRAGWEGKKAKSGMAFAWFVWERNHSGPPTLNWLDWGEE